LWCDLQGWIVKRGLVLLVRLVDDEMGCYQMWIKLLTCVREWRCSLSTSLRAIIAIALQYSDCRLLRKTMFIQENSPSSCIVWFLTSFYNLAYTCEASPSVYPSCLVTISAKQPRLCLAQVRIAKNSMDKGLTAEKRRPGEGTCPSGIARLDMG
jgi:hypothetical protein